MPFSPDITLGNDYLTPFYADQVLPKKIREKKVDWDDAVRAGTPTSRSRLGQLSGPYFTARPAAEDADRKNPEAHLVLCRIVARGLGYPVTVDDTDLSVGTYRAGGTHIDLPALAHLTTPDGRPYAVVVPAAPPRAGGIITDPALLIDSADGQLAVEAHKHDDPDALIDGTGTAVGLASTLFHPDEPLRWIIVIGGGAVTIIDRAHWTDGKWLGVNIDTALGTADTTPGGGYDQITYLFSHDAICGDEILIDIAVEGSRKEAVGVSEQLRDAVRHGVELLANEVIRDRIDRRHLSTFGRDGGEQINPQDLARQCIRWMYRLVVLLYAEARPTIGILPTRHPIYEAGYSMDRLRRLALVDLRTEEAMHNRHFDLSLRLLFDKVNNGHQPPAQQTLGDLAYGVDDQLPLGVEGQPSLRDDTVSVASTRALSWTGMEFDALRSKLFGSQSCPDIDAAHLRDDVLQQIVKGLTAVHTRRGYEQVSYANLEINQLGAVYEGLMAYTGMFARQPMHEVTGKNADGSKGSWLVPVERAIRYPEEVFVTRRLDTGETGRLVHPDGAFVFRLAGRDRKRSASFYTPSVLTEFTVRHALDEWREANPDATAAGILNLTILEPALGSGAFANEAIDQLANLYLAKQQDETGLTVPPEDREREVRKLRAHFAVNQTYGVDLNDTAVELAEVGLWLNAMHPGLAAPSLAARLRRGNSLIGSRRATYTPAQAAKQPWKHTSKSPAVAPDYAHPAEVPFGTASGILHFLLPGEGWGAAAKTGKTIVRELAPDWCDTVRTWRKKIQGKPTKAQIERVRALSTAVERLWVRAAADVTAHMAAHDRTIDVWAQPDQTRRTPGPAATGYTDPNGAYARLKTIMDAWCALWLWAPENVTDLPTLDGWLDMVEYLAGSLDDHADGTLFTCARRDETTERFGKGSIDQARTIWAWLEGCAAIVKTQGFFHWDLDYAPVLTAGGFDLQVGNPPWVRPTWDEAEALSEHDPWWGITDLTSTPKHIKDDRRTGVLNDARVGARVAAEAAENLGLNALYGASSREPDLTGVQTNLYMNFITGIWPRTAPTGTAALLHPESHFVDPKAGPLRAATYTRIRRHWQFANGDFLFEDVHDQTEFGVHVYGSAGPVEFVQTVSLLQPATVDGSMTHDGEGDTPGVKFPDGGWDRRPHAARIVTVTDDVLIDWVRLFDPPGTPARQSRLLRPLTQADVATLTAFAEQPTRLADHTRHWTAGFHEKMQKDDGTIEWDTCTPNSLDQTILQGPHILNATPYGQTCREVVRHNQDYDPIDLEDLPADFVWRTNYQPAVPTAEYRRRARKWDGEPFFDRVREAHRQFVPATGVRTMQAVLLPPGPAHTGSLASHAGDPFDTTLAAGLFASMPYDFVVKVFGMANLKKVITDRLPVPDMAEVLERELVHRTLRLNCLTAAYGDHWADLHDPSWDPIVRSVPAQTLSPVTAVWTVGTPARQALDRWGLLCDLDAIAAVALGITEDQLVAMYRSTFGVLRMYEHEMAFDSQGRQVTRQHHAWDAKQQTFEDLLKEDNKAARRGQQQPKLWDRVVAYRDGDTAVDLAYLQPPFRRADRELAMRTAYRHFAELAADSSGVSDAPLGDWEVWG